MKRRKDIFAPRIPRRKTKSIDRALIGAGVGILLGTALLGGAASAANS